ncbi:helix-turn-helix domain-containing protein [Streptomyces sp. Edi2]|uniref:helix-turn-helix domain-containing protein n=1 Tax=Streptomyces sp. Edi2 TaxID=3162528 RepID=UPI00330585FC
MPNATTFPAPPAAGDASPNPPKVPRGKRLVGEKATAFHAYVVSLYRREPHPMSIRAICEETGRSYGNIHTILKNAKVDMRPRGYQRPTRREEPRDGE